MSLIFLWISKNGPQISKNVHDFEKYAHGSGKCSWFSEILHKSKNIQEVKNRSRVQFFFTNIKLRLNVLILVHEYKKIVDEFHENIHRYF